MWNVEPNKMCNQHILGEHYECHMFVGAINKGTSMEGFFKNGMLDIKLLKERHTKLVVEMEIRGMKHLSNLPEFTFDVFAATGSVSHEESVRVLKERCIECSELLSK